MTKLSAAPVVRGRRRWLYAAWGGLLACGAPAGLFLLRAMRANDFALTIAWLVGELRRDAATYAYVGASTAVVFIAMGFFVGWQQDRLFASAISDTLTGLSNRRFAERRVENEVERVRRFGGAVSLLIIDVDRLKQINDAGGHAAGDRALLAVAEALRRCARRTDVAARWAGDEFVVVAPGTAKAEAIRLAERVRQTLSTIEGAPTVSIGIADTTRESARSATQIAARADAALYLAKEKGRDRVEVEREPTEDNGA